MIKKNVMVSEHASECVRDAGGRHSFQHLQTGRPPGAHRSGAPPSGVCCYRHGAHLPPHHGLSCLCLGCNLGRSNTVFFMLWLRPMSLCHCSVCYQIFANTQIVVLYSLECHFLRCSVKILKLINQMHHFIQNKTMLLHYFRG